MKFFVISYRTLEPQFRLTLTAYLDLMLHLDTASGNSGYIKDKLGSKYHLVFYGLHFKSRLSVYYFRLLQIEKTIQRKRSVRRAGLHHEKNIFHYSKRSEF